MNEKEDLIKVFERLNIIMSGYRETLIGLIDVEETDGVWRHEICDEILNQTIKVNKILNEERPNWKLVGFNIGYSSNLIILSGWGSEETLENMTILPVENTKHCVKLIEGTCIDEELNKIVSIITEIMSKKFSTYFSK